MSTVKVNTISTWTGSDVGIETGKTISGTASQFKMTDVVQGDVLYGSAADTLSRLAPGTSGQVLQTQGAGANPVWAADAQGKVLQVLQSVKTDTASTTSVATFVDIAGTDQAGAGSVWCVKITPAATTSKILFSCDVYAGTYNDIGMFYIMKRDTTSILLADAASARTRTSFTVDANQGNNVEGAHMTYLDSPSSTSELTYKVQWALDSAQTLYLNRSLNDTDNAAHPRSTSTITVMEIGA